MSSLNEFFIAAGPLGYLIVLCCTAAFPLGLAAIGAAFKHKGAGLGLGALTLLAGLTQWVTATVAYVHSIQVMEEALASASVHRATLRAAGEAEAESILMMGGCMGAGGVLFGIAAIAIAIVKKRPSEA